MDTDLEALFEEYRKIIAELKTEAARQAAELQELREYKEDMDARLEKLDADMVQLRQPATGDRPGFANNLLSGIAKLQGAMEKPRLMRSGSFTGGDL